MYPSAYPYPMRGDCGSRTQPCTVLQTVANPVGVIADGVLSARWGRTPAPLPDRPVPVWRETEKPSCRNRRAPYVSIEAREKKPRIPYGLHSETRRGIGRSGMGLVWLPAEDSNLVERFQRPVCCRYTSGECVGVLAESPTKIRRSHLVRHRSRTQWHVHDRVRAALTRPALPLSASLF